ncbi:MAG: TIR domain-containing protein, partial [Cytophagaceae bacterium]
NASERSPLASTFLSHSSKDSDLLPGVVHLLQSHGAVVYIDKKDETLPPFTCRSTALTLRGRIEQSKKMVLFATENSKDSRWVPWELGLGDGLKKGNSVAILPSIETNSDQEWVEREYLGIYDRIVFGRIQGIEDMLWMVLNQEKNTAMSLRSWLSR